ncbi:hypothetical protein AAEU42_11095 [Pseudoflavonifractor phocaeensis]|uniref:hypothetical protein n=1 Tax=Pseudoflavonifractor phocaeensis TaxID=1870988 RepID=UPI0030917F12|nr:hypothetical protein CE91St43_00600 [Oscillospiraceae bacterium]
MGKTVKTVLLILFATLLLGLWLWFQAGVSFAYKGFYNLFFTLMYLGVVLGLWHNRQG